MIAVGQITMGLITYGRQDMSLIPLYVEKQESAPMNHHNHH
jgi:hypothetical protein